LVEWDLFHLEFVLSIVFGSDGLVYHVLYNIIIVFDILLFQYHIFYGVFIILLVHYTDLFLIFCFPFLYLFLIHLYSLLLSISSFHNVFQLFHIINYKLFVILVHFQSQFHHSILFLFIFLSSTLFHLLFQYFKVFLFQLVFLIITAYHVLLKQSILFIIYWTYLLEVLVQNRVLSNRIIGMAIAIATYILVILFYFAIKI